MRNPAARVVSARAPSAAMTMADKPEAFRPAEAPAWAAVALRAAPAAAEPRVAVGAAVRADAGDRRSFRYR